MFSKINVCRIIVDHFDTMRDDATRKVMKSDFFLFLGVPLLVAVLFPFVFAIELEPEAINILVTSLSIFAALLFNLLMLIYDIIQRSGSSTTDLRARFMKQIFANISFSILISFLAVIIMLLAFFAQSVEVLKVAFSLVAFFLITQFALTVLMVLKRVHALMTTEFDDLEEET